MSDYVYESSPALSESTAFRYPFASSPDIIRAHQKDAYFQGVLLERLSTILRSIYGARFAHAHTSEARTFTELLYLGLTTFVGNRTLGEEYCDIVQVSDDTLQLPSIVRRAAYILSSVLFPYGLTRILPSFRRKLRSKLELSIRRSSRKPGAQPWVTKLQTYLLSNLDTITSPSPIYALSLAAFYFTGSYYHLSKRLTGLRYIFTHKPSTTTPQIGYEVLGVLLACQLAVQGYIHLHSTYTSRASSSAIPANTASQAGSSAIIDAGVEISLDPQAYSSNNALLFESDSASSLSPDAVAERVAKTTHTPSNPDGAPVHDLADEKVMMWIGGAQQRKCTLCLEPMRDPSVTTCGHVFCWGCIRDWVREKAECPLCRQVVLGQHVLPLRG